MRGRCRVLACVLFGGLALAAEPPPITPAPQGAGLWRTELIVPVPVEAVLATLEDPIAAARFSPDITSIAYLKRSECATLRVVTEGFIDVSYDYLRCRTADGWHETLVASDSLSALDVRWRLTPVPEGTRISYDVKVKSAIPAPEFMVARQMKSSITTLLGRLYRAVTGSSGG